jgi:hypothetical protein
MLGILFASVQNVLKDRLSGKWKMGSWFLCELLAKHNMTIAWHTRDSPYLVPCDFFLSVKTEDSLKGKETE